jgi:hypothetical protein
MIGPTFCKRLKKMIVEGTIEVKKNRKDGRKNREGTSTIYEITDTGRRKAVTDTFSILESLELDFGIGIVLDETGEYRIADNRN